MPKPIVEHEVEYESVLVAFEDGHYSAEAIATAAQLAARRRRGIHVLVTITVPANTPIDASHARGRVEGTGSDRLGARPRRPPGDGPLGEGPRRARPGGGSSRRRKEIRARAIVMPLPRARGRHGVFGRTLETVLAERPCRVIIDSSLGKAEAAEGAGRA